MKKELRKHTLKQLLPLILTFAILAAGLLGISAGGLMKLVSGPEPMNTADPQSQMGHYVSFDASKVIVACASLSNSGTDQVLKTYYLLPADNNMYLAVVDVKEANDDVLTKAMDQSREYYLGDLETLTSLGNISGTVKSIEDDMTSFLTDCIDNYALPGYEEGRDSANLIIPCQIELDRLGFLSIPLALILGGLGLLSLIVMLALLIPALTGAYQKKALATALEHDDADTIERDFNQGNIIERVHAGKYIWYPKGASTRVVKAEDVVWGYIMPEPLVVSKYRWPVALYTGPQEMTQICFMDKKNCQKLLDAIAEQGHPFIGTYSPAYAQKFKTDYEGFCKMAEKE